MRPADDDTTDQVALAITRARNRDLLGSLFADYEVVDVDDAVPAGTDVCVVDEGGLGRAGDAVETWRAEQRPTLAPVLLLVEDADDPWATYGDAIRGGLDAIQPIPAPRSAVAERVETLLEARAYSRELEREHQLTKRIFETSPLAKTVLDAEGEIVHANDRAEEVLGLSTSTITGRTYDDPDWRIIDDDGEEIPSEELPFARVMETGEPVYGYEHAVERPDGEVVWLSISMGPIYDETGEIEYVVAAMEDITDRRAQALELERQLDLFEKAQDIADVGAWEYDCTTDDAYWTDGARRIYGLVPDVEASPELALTHFHPEDRPTAEAAFERAVEAGEPYDLELRLADDAGDVRWVRTRAEPQYEDGEVVRLRGTVQDVTDRKERELDLRRMSRAVDEAPIGVTLSDPDREDNPLIYVNDAFVRMTGYDREDVVGRNCRFLQGENTDPEQVAQLREAIDAARPVSVVLRNYRADGTEFWNRLEIAPVRDADGEVINFIGFQQDVTERVERRRQLDVLDRYLRHNLRNRMNVVQGMAELIAERGDPPLTTYAERIESTSADLLANVDKQRQITRVLNDDPTVEPVDLMAKLDAILDAARERHPEATLSLSGPDAVELQTVPELSLAFEELVANAVEHSEASSPTVEVTVSTDDEVVVRVADDGPGVPEMEIEVLTGAEEETAVYHGQGLGLWLVYLVVRRAGGTVDFGDTDDGSVVTVALPRDRE